jgi:glycosyltransferase involved in cell wall biosynthesis
MRIVTLLTSLGVGGAEKQALAVAGRMAKRGHTVAVLVLMPRQAEEWPAPIQPFYLGIRKTPASVLAGLIRARRYLGEFRPDLVHSHSFPANLFARLLRPLVPGVAVLSTVHNVYEGRWGRMLAYRLTDGLSRHTVAVSEAAAERFIRLKAVPRRKCTVVPNGIDVAEFAPDPGRRVQMRKEMGLRNESENAEFVWLAVGRIAPAKDYPNLLRAFVEVHRQRSNTRLWIAGEGPDAGIGELQALCEELGIGGAVRWLGLRRDLPALLDAADAFVLGSAWEGMPLAVGEAMAMEKPVVATDVGGVRQLVGNAGMLVEAKNTQALAEAMIATMRLSREELGAQGHAARDRVARRFSVDAAADTWEALYRSLIGCIP